MYLYVCYGHLHCHQAWAQLVSEEVTQGACIHIKYFTGKQLIRSLHGNGGGGGGGGGGGRGRESSLLQHAQLLQNWRLDLLLFAELFLEWLHSRRNGGVCASFGHANGKSALTESKQWVGGRVFLFIDVVVKQINCRYRRTRIANWTAAISAAVYGATSAELCPPYHITIVRVTCPLTAFNLRVRLHVYRSMHSTATCIN